jgi:hypothetical protein
VHLVTPEVAVKARLALTGVDVGTADRDHPRRAARWSRIPGPAWLWPALVGALFLLVTALIVGPMVGAPLGPHDDHELPVIAAQLRTEGLFPTLASWLDEGRGRFRPAYWVIRVTETALWGLDTRGWYLDRAALLLASLWAGYLLARLRFSPGVSVLAALLLVAGPQAESFGRLGPQEAYAVPLSLAGFALIGRRREAGGLLLLVLSAFIKEPFIPLAFLGVAWAWRRNRKGAAILGCLALGIALSGAVYHLLAEGHLTGQVRSPSTIAWTAIDIAAVTAAVTGWPLAIFADDRRWLALIAAAIVLPQVFILADLNVAQRYLYPAVFAAILGAAAAAARSRILYVLVAAILVVNVGRQALATTNRLAATRSFASFVAMLGAQDLPIVIHTDGNAVTERAVAIRRYLPSSRISLVPSVANGSDAFDPYVPGPCVEVDVDIPAAGLCATAYPVP